MYCNGSRFSPRRLTKSRNLARAAASTGFSKSTYRRMRAQPSTSASNNSASKRGLSRPFFSKKLLVQLIRSSGVQMRGGRADSGGGWLFAFIIRCGNLLVLGMEVKSVEVKLQSVG